MNAPHGPMNLLGEWVKVSPEEAAANALLFAQSRRRREAETITHIYRSKSTGAVQAEDAADEEEIEVAVDGEWQPSEPDVGITGGFCVHRTATRIDNGAAIELTADEVTRIEEQETEDAADDGPDPDSAWDSRYDR